MGRGRARDWGRGWVGWMGGWNRMEWESGANLAYALIYYLQGRSELKLT